MLSLPVVKGYRVLSFRRAGIDGGLRGNGVGGGCPAVVLTSTRSWVRGFQDDWYWKPVLKPASRTVRTVVTGWATNSGRCYHRVAIPTKRSAIDGARFGANAL